VILPDGDVLSDPDIETLAVRLGLPTEPTSAVYDLVVIGGGPAGLAASIYAGSEGLRTVVVEQDVPGGQASYSAMIENYPGFQAASTAATSPDARSSSRSDSVSRSSSPGARRVCAAMTSSAA
jgi:thioredoxin reductase (NADPH)